MMETMLYQVMEHDGGILGALGFSKWTYGELPVRHLSLRVRWLRRA